MLQSNQKVHVPAVSHVQASIIKVKVMDSCAGRVGSATNQSLLVNPSSTTFPIAVDFVLVKRPCYLIVHLYAQPLQTIPTSAKRNVSLVTMV